MIFLSWNCWISAGVWKYCAIYQEMNEKLESKVDIMREISGKVSNQKIDIWGRQFIIIATCNLYDTSNQDFKKSRISVYLEIWRKFESLFASGWIKILKSKTEDEVNGLGSTVQIFSNGI